MPVSAHDVAAYTLDRLGPTHTLKLQKLLYYLQAWTLVATDERLYREEIHAFEKGPVVKELWATYRGSREIRREALKGDAARIPFDVIPVLDAVLDFYGPVSRFDLIDMTHNESPWKSTWDQRGERGDRIATSAMRDFYRDLSLSSERTPHLPPVKHTLVPDLFLAQIDCDVESASETWMNALRAARAVAAG